MTGSRVYAARYCTCRTTSSSTGRAYYDHLQAVRDDGAWEASLAFFLKGAIQVAGVLSGMAGYARDRRFHYAPCIPLFNEA